MIDTITEHKFIDYFRGSDQWRNHFSYAACQKLFELIEEDPENECVEFCHYSITEEWAEYDTIDDYLEENKDNEIVEEENVVWYDIEKWDWDKDGNKLVIKSVLINKYQSE